MVLSLFTVRTAALLFTVRRCCLHHTVKTVWEQGSPYLLWSLLDAFICGITSSHQSHSVTGVCFSVVTVLPHLVMWALGIWGQFSLFYLFVSSFCFMLWLFITFYFSFLTIDRCFLAVTFAGSLDQPPYSHHEQQQVLSSYNSNIYFYKCSINFPWSTTSTKEK